MTQVFKVHDDEWEEIVGVQQLEEHAKVQMECFADEIGYVVKLDTFVDVDGSDVEEKGQTKDSILSEELNYRLGDTSQLENVKRILDKYRNNETFTVEESKLVLALRNFETIELDIH